MAGFAGETPLSAPHIISLPPPGLINSLNFSEILIKPFLFLHANADTELTHI